MDIRLEDEVPMTAQELWQTLHTPEFDAFMAAEYEIKAYKELEKQVSTRMIRRRMQATVGTHLSYIPFGLAQRIFGSDEVVVEALQYKHLDRFEMHWVNQVTHPVWIGDKIRVSGVLRVVPIDESRCTRIQEAKVHIGVFGTDSILEGMAAQLSRRANKMFANVVAKWKTAHAQRPGVP